MFKLDMHSHTRGSDGTGTPEEITEAAIDAGLDGLCLTDHHCNSPEDNAEVYRVADCLESAGIRAFIGVEYSTKQGHLLIYGIDVWSGSFGMYPNMQDVIDEVNGLGGACVAAHPYKGYRYSLQDRILNIKGLAAVEGMNGQCFVSHNELNRKAQRAAECMALPCTGGSDAHFVRSTGINYTVFPDVDDIANDHELVLALQAGNFHPEVNQAIAKREKGFMRRRAKTRKKTRKPMALLPPAPSPDGYFGNYGSFEPL